MNWQRVHDMSTEEADRARESIAVAETDRDASLERARDHRRVGEVDIAELWELRAQRYDVTAAGYRAFAVASEAIAARARTALAAG